MVIRFLRFVRMSSPPSVEQPTPPSSPPSTRAPSPTTSEQASDSERPARIQYFQGHATTATLHYDMDKADFLSLKEKDYDDPIVFKYREVVTLVAAFEKLQRYMKDFDPEPDYVGTLFIEPIYECKELKRVRLKCHHLSPKTLLTTIQQDHWDAKKKRWKYASSPLQGGNVPINYVRFFDNEHREFYVFLKRCALN